jgi:hypothetical protein
VGTVSLQETADRSARKAEDLARAFALPVLTEIPEIVTFEDELSRKKRLKIGVASAVMMIMIMGLIIHFFVMDIDVLLIRVMKYVAI